MKIEMSDVKISANRQVDSRTTNKTEEKKNALRVREK